MLPSLEVCQFRLEQYKQKAQQNPRWQGYEREWNEFQEYKREVESKTSSILDAGRIEETSDKLKNFLNMVGACRPGQLDVEKLKLNLRNISYSYESIREVTLGDG